MPTRRMYMYLYVQSPAGIKAQLVTVKEHKPHNSRLSGIIMTEEKILTAHKVRKTIIECLYEDAEITLDSNGDPSNVPADAVLAEGVIHSYAFDPKRVAAQRENIRALLNELPQEFHVDQGGGFSFLSACMDKNGNHWAEHSTIDDLICLGIATGFVTIPAPRDMWQIFPGSVPYFTVDTRPVGLNGTH